VYLEEWNPKESQWGEGLDTVVANPMIEMMEKPGNFVY